MNLRRTDGGRGGGLRPRPAVAASGMVDRRRSRQLTHCAWLELPIPRAALWARMRGCASGRQAAASTSPKPATRPRVAAKPPATPPKDRWRPLRETHRRPPAPVQRAVEQTPEAWKGLHGDTTAKGTLTEFDCAARPPLAPIDNDSGVLTLRAARPNPAHPDLRQAKSQGNRRIHPLHQRLAALGFYPVP